MSEAKVDRAESTFGVRLRAARMRRRLAHDTLGVLAGLNEASSSARISRYEAGIHKPDEQIAKKLARVLEVPLAYLYCDDELIASLLLQIGAMSIEKRRKLLNQLSG